MKNEVQFQEVKELLQVDLRIPDNQNSLVSVSLNQLREEIKRIVADMINSDFERLLNAMYRLDINEVKFREVISGLHGNDVSGILADMIIDRELKKIETRQKYRL